MARFGQFSHLWASLCDLHGLGVDCVDMEWGKGVPAEIFAENLAADKCHEIKAV